MKCEQGRVAWTGHLYVSGSTLCMSWEASQQLIHVMLDCRCWRANVLRGWHECTGGCTRLGLPICAGPQPC
jgi:hypothetical protein